MEPNEANVFNPPSVHAITLFDIGWKGEQLTGWQKMFSPLHAAVSLRSSHCLNGEPDEI